MANAKNYELLEENRSSALKFAEKIHKEQTAQPKALHQIPKSLNSIEDLTAAITALNEKKDNNLGIFWREEGNHRIRDARDIDPKNAEAFKKDAGEKYAMQILNEVRGAILLIEQSDITDKETAKAKLLLIAEKSLTEIDQLQTKIKIYNSALVEVLETSGIKDAAEQLNFAKEISSFKDEHKNIITLNKIEGKTVIEADVMLSGLTDSQKEQYTKIANNEIPDFTPAKLSATDRVKKLFGQYKPKEDPYAWYKELPKYKRDLIKGVARDIVSGKKVIPAQLRELIGLRNAYEKTTTIIKDGEAKILVQGIHCGAPASKNKHNKDDITKENIKQLQSFTAEGSKLNLNILSSLTSKIPFFKKQGIRGENWITNRLKKASKEDKEVSISASPINRFRLLGGGREQKAFDQTLENIAEFLMSNQSKELGPRTKKLQKYLSTGTGDFDEALKEIKSLGEKHPLKIGLMAALNARKNLNNPNSLLGKNLENTNLEISADMLIVQQSLNNGFLGGALPPKNAIITFCKSGKDRTGLVMLKASQRGLQYELDGAQSKDVLLKLAQGGHTQEMAGIQGGSVGNHSIKTSKKVLGVRGEFALNEADEHIQKIISQKSSGFNSEIKQVDSSFFNRIINQAKFKKDKKATKKLINEIDTESQKKKATEVKKPTNTEYLPLPVTPYNKTTNTERQISG